MGIVAATGTAATAKNSDLAQRLERAMSKAVLRALADGVTLDDSDEILRRKAEARAAVLAQEK